MRLRAVPGFTEADAERDRAGQAEPGYSFLPVSAPVNLCTDRTKKGDTSWHTITRRT